MFSRQRDSRSFHGSCAHNRPRRAMPHVLGAGSSNAHALLLVARQTAGWDKNRLAAQLPSSVQEQQLWPATNQVEDAAGQQHEICAAGKRLWNAKARITGPRTSCANECCDHNNTGRGSCHAGDQHAPATVRVHYWNHSVHS